MQDHDTPNQNLSHGLKYELFEESLLNPLRGLQLARDEGFVATMLLDATAANPIGIKRLRRALADAGLPCTERHVKSIVRTLRKSHRLPILSRRNDGGGFWWCENEEQMKEYYDHASGQPLDSLETLHGMIRHNYKRLAGQLSIQDIESEPRPVGVAGG